jgi:alpha-D-ribose 1-methylphosphonate 5-triphosphate synthase subunit PhnL
MAPVLELSGIAKSFTVHPRGGLRIPVLSGVSFQVMAGECVALEGPSGAGKSSVLKMIYASYTTDSGAIWVADGARAIDVAQADPRTILALRRDRIGYVSQFLHVVPRVATREVVADPLLLAGMPPAAARERAEQVLRRLGILAQLWDLAPATFSGGEQQRINVARGLIADHALLLLDEPTASLDAGNRRVVIDMILEKKARGVAVVGVFHDAEVRDLVCDRRVDLAAYSARRLAG